MSKKIFHGKYRYDIALEQGMGPHLVAWVSGLMVFFVTLALAVNFGLSTMTQGWVDGLSGSLTVEINASPDPALKKKFDADVRKVLDLAKQHPSVAQGRLLSNAEILKLVEPWLGSRVPEDIALPALVDLTLTPGGDVQKLQRDILNVVPEAVVDGHAEILGDVRTLVGTARLFVVLLTGVIVALAVLSIAGVVRAKFSIHGQEVETLHLIGASDEYIARQFRHYTLKGALKGAFTGFAAMLIVLLAVGYITHTVDSAIFPHLRLMPLQWVMLILSPVLAGSFIAHITAQHAVMRELSKLV
jgi:cell division transport system permease protein